MVPSPASGVGRRASAENPSGATSYSYDPASNLTSVNVNGEDAPTTYNFDAVKLVHLDGRPTLR